jgi:hypothetical protein
MSVWVDERTGMTAMSTYQPMQPDSDPKHRLHTENERLRRQNMVLTTALDEMTKCSTSRYKREFWAGMANGAGLAFWLIVAFVVIGWLGLGARP